jgi:hypothetical protein
MEEEAVEGVRNAEGRERPWAERASIKDVCTAREEEPEEGEAQEGIGRTGN